MGPLGPNDDTLQPFLLIQTLGPLSTSTKNYDDISQHFNYLQISLEYFPSGDS